MGTGGLSRRSFAIQNWSRSNRRSHRRTRWASGASCLQSKASTTLSLACAPTAPNSSARWPSTRTSTDSATCEALRASSSRWPRNSSEAFTAFGETHGTRAITADTALRLARFFGTSERFWLNLQTAYDLELERDRLEGRLEREVQVLVQAG